MVLWYYKSHRYYIMLGTILIIEDDSDISHLLQLHLQELGYKTAIVHDGVTGLEEALSKTYDLIILDIMLPGMDGLELCRRLRTQPHYTPVLMLTAKSSEIDRVVGLEIGADDYLTKPFSIQELLARVKALFRRVEAMKGEPSQDAKKPIHSGDLFIEPDKRKVTLRGNPVSLTAKEFDLLLQFAKHPGQVYSRSQLLDLVWGYGYEGYDHTVNSHINRLRSKIEEDPARPLYILTVWGVGYKFSEPQDRKER
jgi:DNA-binding response OmpR family regulator